MPNGKRASFTVINNITSMDPDRAACINSVRPCPFLNCRYHLWAEQRNDDIRVRADASGETCSLDIASQGEHTYQEVARHMGTSWQNVQIIEAQALNKLRRNAKLRGMKEEFVTVSGQVEPANYEIDRSNARA